MTKELICVYQDCPMCGDKGKKLKKIILEKNLNVKKVSFASDEGKDLCHKAVFEHGIKTMPFYTDGKKFSTNIEMLINTQRKTKKVTKKKGVEDGRDS